MSYLFRYYKIENKELTKKFNEIKGRAEKISSLTPNVRFRKFHNKKDMVAIQAISFHLALMYIL